MRAPLAEWLPDVLGCAMCGERLLFDPRGVLACSDCGSMFPVLAGVAVIVPQPEVWLAARRDAVLASLAEAGLAAPEVIELCDLFAGAARGADPVRFADDWVAAETGAPWPEVPADHADSFGAFVDAARDNRPAALVPRLLSGDPIGAVLELGVGAGEVAAALAADAERMLVADLSLRAVLRTLSRVREIAPDLELAGAVVDADALRLRPASIDTVVAANLIDLLDYPEGLVEEVAAGLRPDGRLVLTTPDPALGDPMDEERLLPLIERAGLAIAADEPFVPWLRPHRDREWQVYFVRALVARR